MRIEVKCPNRDCGETLVLTPEMAGRTGRCSKCGKTFQIPRNLGASRAGGAKPPSTPPPEARKPANPPPAAAKPPAAASRPARPAPRKPAARRPAAPAAGSRGSSPKPPPARPAPRCRPPGNDAMAASEFAKYLGADDAEPLDEVEFLDDEDVFDAPPPRRRPARRDDFEDYEDYGAPLPVTTPRRSTGAARKRRARKRTGPSLSPTVIFGLVGSLLTLLLFGMAFAVPSLARPIMLGFAIVGGSLCLVGGFWGLARAFEESPFCGFCYWVVPFYALYYLLSRWDEQKQPFLLSLCGFGFGLAAIVLLFWAPVWDAAGTPVNIRGR